MRYRNRKFRSCPALTILEIVIALVIMAIVFAAVLPQFRVISNGWDSRQANTEVLQNGRVLIEHISRNLSKAVRITAVSNPSQTNGYIEFLADVNDSDPCRYDIGTDNYVEYGPVGSLSCLAGPVSSLTFTCYDVNDLNTPLSPVTDANVIRTVKVDATITNSESSSQNKTFTTWAYLRTNALGSDCWQNQDIGSVGLAGSASESNSTWTINGSGADIWGNTDEFHYVYQPMSGNCQIIARVVSMTSTDVWAKAGVMIRETLTGGSRHAMMVVTPGSGMAFQRRTTTGGTSDHTAGSVVTAPRWVKLVRTGDTFYGYESANGSAWTPVGSASVTMAADVYIGLAVTSHTNTLLCTAVIDSVGFSSVTYGGFTEAKAASDTTSITISTTGSAVAILGSWLTGTTHAKESGTNRALVFIGHAERGSATSLTSVTYGGRPMTKVVEIINGSGATLTYTAAFILNEAGVAAATSPPGTFTPTWSAAPTSSGYYSVFLQNVNQTTLTGATASNQTATGSPISTSALATGAGDMVIEAGTCSNTGAYTAYNGFAPLEIAITNADGMIGYKSATGVNETPSVAHSTTTERQTLIGFVVRVREETGIEGDLLIAAVATDGDTSASIAAPVGQGWTLIDRGACSGAATLGAWWKLAAASEPASHQFIWSGNEQAYGWMMRFTGHNPTLTDTINDWSTGSDSNSTPASPAVTTTVDNCLILRLGAFDNDAITVDIPGLTTPVSHTTITMDSSSNPTVQYIAAGAVTSGTAAIIPALPAGIAVNDILLLCLETDNETISINNQNGGIWTAVTNSPQGTGTAGDGTATRLTVFWSRYNGTQGDPTTSDSGNHQIGRIIAIRGAVTSGNPWDVTAGGVEAVSDTSGSIPGATTTVANTLVVTIIATALPDATGTANFGGVGDTWVNGDLTSVTERTDNTRNSGNGGGLGVATGTKTTIGAYGNTAVACGTNSYKAMMSIALRPPQTAVSGGAGYIGQSNSGSSGTSNFTLTLPNSSRMLTIAIAPADNNSCQGSVEP